MPHDCTITSGLLTRQRTMFRLAERDHSITHKVVSLETGMSLSAIGQYARGETAMSGPAILKLAAMEDFPSSLLSLLFDGTSRCVVDEEGEEPDFDARATSCIEYLGEHTKARHPSSPGGEKIVAVEKPALVAKLRRAAA